MVRSCRCRSRRKGTCADLTSFAVARMMGVGRWVGARPRDGRRPARRFCKGVRFLRERRAGRFENLLVVLAGEGHCLCLFFFWMVGIKKRFLFEVRICVCREKVGVEGLVGNLDAFNDNRVLLLFSLAGNVYARSGRLPCFHSLWPQVFQSELMRLDQPTAREHSPMLTMII